MSFSIQNTNIVIDNTSAITIPPTPSAGQTVIYLKEDKLLYYKDDTGVERGPGFNVSAARRTRGSSQSIANITATIIDYETLIYDNLNELDDTGRFTARANGIYHVSAAALFGNVAWDAAEIAQIALYKNGSSYAEGYIWSAHAAVTRAPSASVISDVSLLAGDYIDVRAYHNQGAAVIIQAAAAYNYLSVHRIA